MIQFGANFSTLGVPETGLSPTITIRDTSDGSVVVNGAAMTEVGGGAYKYNFSNDIAKKYSVVIDGGVDTLDSRYMTAWSERAKAEVEIVDILGDTNELQGNQNNWLTATEFSTHNADDVKAAMEAAGTKLTTVKDQTDKMNFSGNNIQTRVADKGVLNDLSGEDINSVISNNEVLKRVIGLMHENIFIDNPIYDDNDNLESARVRIYSDSISVGTDINIIGSYIVTSVGSGRGKFTSWSQIKN